jgi:hypothetical protein
MKSAKKSRDDEDLKATDEKHRQRFRAALVASIQEALAAADRPPRLATFWDDLASTSSALTPQLSLIHSNLTLIRRVKKVASDAKRLQGAISTLRSDHPANAAVLEDFMHYATRLYPTMRDAERISEHANKMGDRLKTTKTGDGWRFAHGLAGQDVHRALIRARVRITTRNDFTSRTKGKSGKPPSGQKRCFAYLPPIDQQSSLAMRCAMLVLFDAGHQELDWSSARALIRVGRKFRVAGVRLRRHIADTREELMSAVRAIPYANAQREQMEDLISTATGSEVEIELADEATTPYFTQMHWADAYARLLSDDDELHESI